MLDRMTGADCPGSLTVTIGDKYGKISSCRRHYLPARRARRGEGPVSYTHLDVYKRQEHQRRVYEDVVFNDMSLSEIAEEQGISRQGVHDLVKRCLLYTSHCRRTVWRSRNGCETLDHTSCDRTLPAVGIC